MPRIFLLMLVAVVCCHTLAAEEAKGETKRYLTSADDCKSASLTATKLFLDKNYLEAIESLLVYKEFKDVTDAVQSAVYLKKQMEMVADSLGEVRGSEYASAAKFGESLIVIDCINKYAKGFVRWEFVYYKFKATWSMVNVNLDYSSSMVDMINKIRPAMWEKLEVTEPEKNP